MNNNNNPSKTNQIGFYYTYDSATFFFILNNIANFGRWWVTGRLVCCSPWGHKELDTTWQMNNNCYTENSKLPKTPHPMYSNYKFNQSKSNDINPLIRTNWISWVKWKQSSTLEGIQTFVKKKKCFSQCGSKIWTTRMEARRYENK